MVLRQMIRFLRNSSLKTSYFMVNSYNLGSLVEELINICHGLGSKSRRNTVVRGIGYYYTMCAWEGRWVPKTLLFSINFGNVLFS